MPPSAKAQRFVNKWGARLIPLILVGIVGYATWVVPVLIGVNRLLNPPDLIAPRRGAGITIIVLYFILLLPMAATYARTVYLVMTQPGFVPLPSKTHRRKRRRSGSRKSTRHDDIEKASSHSEGSAPTPSEQVGFLDRGAIHGGRLAPPPGLDRFFSRDVFECEVDGLPRWCATCQAWKPDRSHHSSEVGRCVYKLDHFCPWAAGIVSESSFKPFLLFCVYGALYCVFVLVVTAFFTAEQHRLGEPYDVNIIVIIALSGLFGLFASGMAGNTMHAVLINSTTVDNLTRRSRVHHFCVSLSLSQSFTSSVSTSLDFPTGPITTITYPLHGQKTSSDSDVPVTSKRYAVLATPAGSNPYDLTSKLDNARTVMGESLWEWFWPFSSSPCERHAHHDKVFGNVMYKLGPMLAQVIAASEIPQRGRQEIWNGDEAARQPRYNSGGDTPPASAPAHVGPQRSVANEQHALQGSVTMERLREGRARDT